MTVLPQDDKWMLVRLIVFNWRTKIDEVIPLCGGTVSVTSCPEPAQLAQGRKPPEHQWLPCLRSATP
eukprot:3605949-Amphidinium_carterae.5